MKYAVVESGGKQFVAREGETFEVDRLPAAVGQAVPFDSVLLAADGDVILVGSPHVSGAKVQTTVESQVRGPKILVFRYMPKKRRRKRMGSRSFLTRLHVDAITVPGGSGAGRSEPEKPAAAPRRKAAPAKAKSAPPAHRGAAKPPAKKPAKTKK